MIVPTPVEAIDLALLFPAWQARAACKGTGPQRFFVELGGDTHPARRVCATCPVRVDCLEYALATPLTMAGIWGGAGEADRRYFKKLRRRRRHGPGPVEGCRCGWCRQMGRHEADLALLLLPEDDRRRLTRDQPAPPNRNSSGATHGRRSTQAKGCRCEPCRWSASATGVVLAKLGFQTSELWPVWTAGVPPELAREVATQAGEDLVVDVVIALMALSGTGVEARRHAVRFVDARRAERERRSLTASGGICGTSDMVPA